ncbi:hypothetical protein C8R47DRAFT_1082202 [Mycena vitilis]|nr:hypothetical protein C8R47DRAFT_1082202 [Mycena vitilis]
MASIQILSVRLCRFGIFCHRPPTHGRLQLEVDGKDRKTRRSTVRARFRPIVRERSRYRNEKSMRLAWLGAKSVGANWPANFQVLHKISESKFACLTNHITAKAWGDEGVMVHAATLQVLKVVTPKTLEGLNPCAYNIQSYERRTAVTRCLFLVPLERLDSATNGHELSVTGINETRLQDTETNWWCTGIELRADIAQIK